MLALQMKKASYGIGDLVADGIKSATLGTSKPCVCEKRPVPHSVVPKNNPLNRTKEVAE